MTKFILSLLCLAVAGYCALTGDIPAMCLGFAAFLGWLSSYLADSDKQLAKDRTVWAQPELIARLIAAEQALKHSHPCDYRHANAHIRARSGLIEELIGRGAL